MGNVMCCCKGRDKIHEEGKQDEGGIPGVMSKTPTGLDNSEIVEISIDYNKFENKPMSNPHDNAATRHISNFSTFAGENLNVMDEDKMTNHQIKKPNNNNNLIKPLIRNNLSKLNLKVSSANLSNLLTQCPNKNTFIRIQIESLDINYKLCDDFGLQMKPFLEIALESQECIKVFPNSEGDLDKSLNASNISGLLELETSFNNLNTSQNLRKDNSFILTNNKEKSYPFKFAKCFEIDSQFFFTNITFMVKNDLPGPGSAYANSNSNSNNSSTSKITPPFVVMGEIKIPINILYKHFKENSFDGYLEIKLKNSSSIGFIKVILTASDKSLVGQDEFCDKLQKAKFLDISVDENINTMKLMDSASNISISQKNMMNVWDKEHIDFEDLNPSTLHKYFNGNDALESNLVAAKEIPRLSAIDSRDLYKLYTDSLNNNNFISLYQILIFFVKMTNKEDLKVAGEFVKLLNEEQKVAFIGIIKNSNANSYVMKQYLIFIYNYMRHFRNNKVNI